MTAINLASLINLLGYAIGIALYVMLLVMVLKHQPASTSARELITANFSSSLSTNGLLLITAVLGLLWNLGAVAMYGLKEIGYVGSPLVSAVSFTALGFLPAVVVHSVLRGRPTGSQRVSQFIAVSAYVLSGTAGAFHFYDGLVRGLSPSLWALRLLTFGYLGLLAVLFLSTRRQQGWKRTIWATALAVFAVSALHLSHHRAGTTDAWYIELTGHHASLPLVLAILYEDYRFAFADIFLKRALALLVLVAVVFGLYIGVASPLLTERGVGNQFDPRSVAILLGLWIVTALLYPWLSRVVVRFVDSVILRRVDYASLRVEVAQHLAQMDTPHEILDHVCVLLQPAISAREVRWIEISSKTDTPIITSEPKHLKKVQTVELGFLNQTQPLSIHEHNVTLVERSGSKGALVFIPSAEAPYYRFEIGILAGGRRLLSDDIAMLDAIAIMVARRIDALRVTHERCEQSLREQEINKLATEAQLKALRAQVNPHFLFNALTTIGYLVQTAPDRAFETLMKLTSLLRAVLRTDGEFVTLEQELQLIASYLDIERARFEERLRVSIDVPQELLGVRVPSLLVQPLVENAIKHGITPAKFGGEVTIRAKLEKDFDANDRAIEVLGISVCDTGVGASEIELARGRRRGVGLSNIEERLRSYGGPSATLTISSIPGKGTSVELRLPLTSDSATQPAVGSLTHMQEKRGA